VVQLAEMLNVLPPSRASLLPQGTVVLGGCGHGAELLVGASLNWPNDFGHFNRAL
jgi:hypothetical protein